MTPYDLESVIATHAFSRHNKFQIEESALCGRFYCFSIFIPDEIFEWADGESSDGPTALCPRCGIDSVIGTSAGFPVADTNFLKQMNTYWFKGRG